MTGRFRNVIGLVIFLVVVFSVLGFLYWRGRLEKSTVVGTSTEHVGPPELYPGPSTSLGATDPRVSQENIGETICVSGWSKRVRPPAYVTSSIKLEMMRQRRLTDGSAYELDHFIPLELGGCADCRENLWLEPYDPRPGAHEKDRVENFLHRKVCGGEMSLAEAQRAISTDWYKVYLEISASNEAGQ